MRIEMLGTGGYHPSERRHTACYFLPGCGLVLDAGTGAFRVLRRVAEGALGASRRLDVLLTHAHLDHVSGLTYLFGLEHDGEPIETVVHAPPGVIEAVREHLLAPAIFPIPPVTRYEPLGERLELPGGAVVSTFPLDHPGGSIGVLIEHDGKRLAYVTDTRPLEEESLARVSGADLLLHEAYFRHARREFAHLTGHTTAVEAAEAADRADAGRLVMIHPDPRADEATEAAAVAEARLRRPEADYGHDRQAIDF